MKVALVLDKRKPQYGPMATGLLKYAKYVTYLDDFRDVYDAYIVFYNKPFHLPTSKPVGWWMNDLRKPTKWGSERVAGAKMDKIFICHKEYWDEYRDLFGAEMYYLPQTGLPTPTVSDRKIDWDVVFIGNFFAAIHYDNRLPITREIRKHVKFKLIANEGFTKDQYYIYKKTPFSLSISPQAHSYTSNRTYNILSAGGFCLSLHFPGIEDLFENHRHLVWFQTPEEAIELINYYKNKPNLCDKIRAQGKALYETHHTPRHRWRYLSQAITGECSPEDDFRQPCRTRKA